MSLRGLNPQSHSLSALKGRSWARSPPLLSPCIGSEAQGQSSLPGAKVYMVVLPGSLACETCQEGWGQEGDSGSVRLPWGTVSRVRIYASLLPLQVWSPGQAPWACAELSLQGAQRARGPGADQEVGRRSRGLRRHQPPADGAQSEHRVLSLL